MSDQLCSGCKFWRALGEPPDVNRHYTFPEAALVIAEANRHRWGWCQKVAEFGPARGSDKFYVIDGSMYRAELNCREDFGCVEWEEGQWTEEQVEPIDPSVRLHDEALADGWVG